MTRNVVIVYSLYLFFIIGSFFYNAFTKFLRISPINIAGFGSFTVPFAFQSSSLVVHFYFTEMGNEIHCGEYAWAPETLANDFDKWSSYVAGSGFVNGILLIILYVILFLCIKSTNVSKKCGNIHFIILFITLLLVVTAIFELVVLRDLLFVNPLSVLFGPILAIWTLDFVTVIIWLIKCYKDAPIK